MSKKNKLFGGISSSNLLMLAALGVGAYVIYKGFTSSSNKPYINPGTNNGNTTNNYNVEIPSVDVPDVVDKWFDPANYLTPGGSTQSQVDSAIQEAINKANGQ